METVTIREDGFPQDLEEEAQKADRNARACEAEARRWRNLAKTIRAHSHPMTLPPPGTPVDLGNGDRYVIGDEAHSSKRGPLKWDGERWAPDA